MFHTGNISEPWYFLKQAALSCGFCAVGVTNAFAFSHTEFSKWLNWSLSDKAAPLPYLRKYLEQRQNITHPKILTDATVVISVALYYGQGHPSTQVWKKIASCARGRDYHLTMREKLKNLANFVKKEFKNAQCRVFVDSAPILERNWAILAGLGFIGKNGILYIPKIGPRIILGEIVCSNTPLQPNKTEINNKCTNCSNCVKACPTKAICEDGKLNLNKCLSCLSIETHTDNLALYQDKMNMIFGCDICTQVCPLLNLKEPTMLEPPLNSLPEKLEDLAKTDIEELKKLLHQTSLYRTGAKKIIQNTKQVIKNLNFTL